jgi:alpha-N-arabinofuranosidase
MSRITVDLQRPVGTVDPRIFGQFIEHLGRCIYGGIYDEGSPLSDEHGFRTDVLKVAGELKAPILRWPGGNFVSGYHWEDGIGPKDERPRRIELAWRGEESNRFGTVEFIQYCRALGTEPYICLNLGTGTPDEAAAWVEYCNGTGNTHWANLRRSHGFDAPFAVKYWGLGNEMYGHWQIGAKTADEYVRFASEFAKILHWVDPTIELVSCGQEGWQDWDAIVIEGLARYVRYHSIHLYTGSHDHWTNVIEAEQADRAIRMTRSHIERTRFRQNIAHEVSIAYDEWNVWFREKRAPAEERYTLSDALAVATFLNIFLHHADSVKVANLAQMVNVIAPIFTRPDGLFLQTTFHPLRLYAEHTGTVALDCHVEGDEREHRQIEAALRAANGLAKVRDRGPFTSVHAAATRSEDGRSLTLTVVNRSPDSAVSVPLDLVHGEATGTTQLSVVTGSDPAVQNSFESPDNVGVTEHALQLVGHQLILELAPCSINVYRIPLRA